jgi:hypothetical protein
MNWSDLQDEPNRVRPPHHVSVDRWPKRGAAPPLDLDPDLAHQRAGVTEPVAAALTLLVFAAAAVIVWAVAMCR